MTSHSRAILIASRNAGKLHELKPMVTAMGFHPVTLDEAGIPEAPEEDGLEQFATFEENALAKARWFHALSAGAGAMAVLADDSGLAVDALAGAPGVISKRWSGGGLEVRAQDDRNNRKLLDELAGKPDRSARFVCAAALVWRDGEFTERGEIAGTVLEAPRGALGFGYDPFFWSDELQVTLAEATREQKERVSHRGRAVRAALERFARLLPGQR